MNPTNRELAERITERLFEPSDLMDPSEVRGHLYFRLQDKNSDWFGDMTKSMCIDTIEQVLNSLTQEGEI